MKSDKRSSILSEKGDVGILRYIVRVLYEEPRNDFAERLIERFGSVHGIFRATYEELMSVNGMTERAASFFTAVLPLNKQALMREIANASLDSEAAVLNFAAVYFLQDSIPADVCVYLNAKNKVIECERSTGEDRVREIVSGVCRYGAKKIVWLRYDPVGSVVSPFVRINRLDSVKRLLRPLSALDVQLIDYIEYAPYRFFGLKRAVFGGALSVDAGDASEENYVDSPDFKYMLDAYYASFVERVNDTE